MGRNSAHPDGHPLVGLVPAAGRATRAGHLPCSKEIHPVGYASPSPGQGGGPRLRVACDDLIDAIAAAGARRAYIVVRDGKWDIPAYLGGGSDRGLALAYLVTAPSPSVPATLTTALPFVADDIVVFGFPDIVFQPVDSLARLAARQRETGADVVLGLFAARDPVAVDMVDVDDGRVRRVEVKPAETALRRAWILAVWTPRFTEFLDGCVTGTPGGDGELHLGHVIQAGIDAGLRVEGVAIDGFYRDVGTPQEMWTLLTRPDPRDGTSPAAESAPG